jgi:hypothetical protein
MLTEALILAEKVHLALVKLSRGSSVFTGCDSSRRPLQGNGHAYILRESDQAQACGGGREITHVTVINSISQQLFGSIPCFLRSLSL